MQMHVELLGANRWVFHFSPLYNLSPQENRGVLPIEGKCYTCRSVAAGACGSRGCDGLDSANIAAGQVLNYGMTADRYGYERLSLRIRVLERYKVGEVRTVPIVPDAESPKANIQVGSKVFLFAGDGPSQGNEVRPGPRLFGRICKRNYSR